MYVLFKVKKWKNQLKIAHTIQGFTDSCDLKTSGSGMGYRAGSIQQLSKELEDGVACRLYALTSSSLKASS